MLAGSSGIGSLYAQIGNRVQKIAFLVCLTLSVPFILGAAFIESNVRLIYVE